MLRLPISLVDFLKYETFDDFSKGKIQIDKKKGSYMSWGFGEGGVSSRKVSKQKYKEFQSKFKRIRKLLLSILENKGISLDKFLKELQK